MLDPTTPHSLPSNVQHSGNYWRHHAEGMLMPLQHHDWRRTLLNETCRSGHLALETFPPILSLLYWKVPSLVISVS